MSEPKFKVGDKVRVLDCREDKDWRTYIDKYIGLRGVVQCIQDSNAGEHPWYELIESCLFFKEEWLEKVEDYTTGPLLKEDPYEEGIHESETGAKQSNLKTMFDLIDAVAILELAHVHWYGAQKYGDDNWRGISLEGHLNHALAHIYKFMESGKKDELTHAFCRLCFAVAKYCRPDYYGKWTPKKD